MHYISGDCLSILQLLKEEFVDRISSLKDILDKFINLRDLQLVLRSDPSQQKKVIEHIVTLRQLQLNTNFYLLGHGDLMSSLCQALKFCPAFNCMEE